MAKQIRANELFEKEDIFEGIRKSAEKTMVTLEKVDVEFKQLGKTLKESIGKASFGGSKELKEFLQLVDKANNLQTQTIKLEKEKTIAEQQNEKLKREKIKTQSAENRETERLNKQKQKAIKLAKDESSAYKKLVKATRDLKNQSKELGSQMLLLEQSGKKNTVEYRKLADQYKKVTRSAQQGDVALKKLDKTVGDNFRNVGNYSGAVNKLRSGLAQLGLAFGIGQIVRSSMKTITDYGTANSKLASILGTTTEKTELLQKVQRKLGASTSFTAGEVALLQTELAKIGFSQQDIADSTEGILLLAKASGTDLANASTIAGATLRGFGLDVKDTSHLADVMAKSFSSSALDIGLFGESMKYVAPVSKSANISLEETTALLSILADNGIKGSQAGTSLKRIMSEMAKTGKPLKEALQDVADAGVDLVSAQDEVGRSAQTSLLILSDNIGKIDEFTEKYEKADGSALAMANTMDDNLAGAVARLNSKWQDFLLGLNEGAGASKKMQNALDYLTKNLSSILGFIGKVVRAWLIYKATLMGLKAIQFFMSTSFKELGQMMLKQIPLTKAYAREQKALALATQKAGKSVQTTGKMMGAVPWVLIISLVVELGLAFYDLATNSAEAKRQQDLLNASIERGKELGEKANKQFSDEYNEKLRLINLKARQDSANTSVQKELDKIEKDRLINIQELTRGQLDFLKLNLQGGEDLIKLAEKRKKVAEAIDISGAKYMIIGNKTVSIEEHRNKQIQIQVNKIAKLKEENKGLAKGISDMSKAYEDSKLSLLELNKEDKKDDKTKKTKRQKTFNTQLRQTNDYLSRQLELIQELTRIRQDRELMTRQEGIESEFDTQLETLGKTGEFDATKLNEMINAKTELEQEYIDQRTIYELDALEKKYVDIENKERKALADQRKKLLAVTDITESAKLKIEADYKIKSDELVAEQKQRQDDRAKEEVIIVERGENEKLEIRKNGFQTLDEYNQEFLDKEKEYNEKLKELDAERIKKRQQSTREFVKATADYFIKKSNEKIAQIDKEIQASEKQYDTLKKLAEEGNIDAKESLAEQQKIIAEANRRKEQEQKRQQRIQLAESVYSTYSSKVEAGSKNPLAETIRDTALLQQFISSLPTFEDGTDDTGTNGRGIDGKGGFLSVLHPNERVVPKSLNEQIGGLTNEQLGQIAMEYNNGKIVRSNSQVGSALELSLLVNKLDNLTKVIQDKPETNIELGEITQGAMEIVKSTRKGNTYTYNRYKVK